MEEELNNCCHIPPGEVDQDGPPGMIKSSEEIAMRVVVGLDFTYWIERKSTSHMHGLTPLETRIRIREGFKDLESVCGATFTEKSNRSAKIDITFHNQKKMYRGALGLMYTSRGEMQINNSRVVSHTKYPSLVQMLVQHEMFHWIRRDGLHSKRSTSVLWENGPTPGMRFIDPTDTRYLQGKYGEPSRLFYPRDKGHIGKQVRASKAILEDLWEIRRELISEREALVAAKEWDLMVLKQAEVLANLEEIKAENAVMIPLNKEWWRLKRWWTVPHTPKAG